MVNHYCCCIIKIPIDPKDPGGEWILRLDSATYPNPEIDPSALEKCKERAKILRIMYTGKYEFFQIEPVIVIIKGIPEEDLR